MQNKILCLGTNSVLTDKMCTAMASDLALINHGLIDSLDVEIKKSGIYHTSMADFSFGQILSLANKFDEIVMLDQPRDVWSHWKILQTTYKVMLVLEQQGAKTVFRNNENVKRLEKISRLVDDNPSWCIYPWINLVTRDETGLMLCARSLTVLSPESSIHSWKNNKVSRTIKIKMLAGEKLPKDCAYCYDYENRGIESYRQYESRDWCNQLDIADLSELDRITGPKYYEVHWGNKCNLRCRGCVPGRSSAIADEFKKHNISLPFKDYLPKQYPTVDIVDISGLDRASRVYISGGEPVIMSETFDFMQRCIDAGRTDFELTMSTNGVKFPQRFLDLSRDFSNLNLSFSLDGYGRINDYWRSGSRWESIVENMRMIHSMGHNVTVNTVPGIYNVTNLHLLLEWLDRTFPMTAVYMQINHNALQSAYNHPDTLAVIDSMSRCQQTQVYWSDGKSCRTSIDSIKEHYEKRSGYDLEDLQAFFDFNDRLDQIRGMHLGDYIPELEACRPLLQRKIT